MTEPLKLVTTKSDKELAEELRQELISSAQPWLEACTKAYGHGFIVQAQFGIDWYGKTVILGMNLIKQY